MTRRTQHPAIPDDKDLAPDAMRESLEIGRGERGDKLDAWVTFRDLEEGGLAITRGGGAGRPSIGSGGPGDTGPFGPDGGDDLDFGENDLTKPPRPTGVKARGISLDAIGLTWNPPAYNNHAYAEVFASFDDNLAAIRDSFDPGRPVSPENQTPFFMGTAAGTLFVHRGLDSTVPTLEQQRPASSLTLLSGNRIRFSVANAGDGWLSVGDAAFFRGPDGWAGVGLQGTVTATTSTQVTVDMGGTLPDGVLPAPSGVVVEKQWQEGDDLDAALNPRAVFYWVRFVSTARVAGDWQGESGVPGSVFINPTVVLNILTGRIRSSQLANDILAPINFVRGPLTEVDGDGNRRFPTIRSFVQSLGDEAITEYDESWQVALGFEGQGADSSSIIFYQRIDSERFSVTTSSTLSGVSPGMYLRIYAAPGTSLSALSGKAFRVTLISGSLYRLTQETQGLSLPVGSFSVESATLQKQTAGSDRPGVASAAVLLEQIRGEANAQGAYIESLNTLQAGFEDGTQDGIRQIIATATQRELVRATDQGALSYIGENVQIETDDGNTYALNEVANQVYLDHEGRLTNSFTVRAQQNRGGVLFAAGMGLSLEEQENGDLRSSFIVSADQFAIMGAGNAGRVMLQIAREANGTVYECQMDVGQGRTVNDDSLAVGELVTVTVPTGSPFSLSNALRGEAFEVISRQNGFQVNDPLIIRIAKPINPDTGTRPGLPFLSSTPLEGLGFAMFPETNVPFIVDTQTATVAIRGRLVVDGMISATSAQIGELAATTVWAETITAFGMINTASLVGEKIATPRFGGWAMRMQMPSEARPRVMEFSRWGAATDDLPQDPESTVNQAGLYPQLSDQQPNETAFWLDSAQGNAYLRGNLTVGGNARFWTGRGAGSADYFIQMDQEFPLFIMPRSVANNTPGFNTVDGGGMTYTNTIRNAIRNNALFWAQRNGQAGFNTANQAIFINETPLEPPSGWGAVSVISRLNQPFGRVYMQAQFAVANDRLGQERLLGYTVGLFLVSANVNYGEFSGGGQNPEVFIPSNRNGIANVNLGGQAGFMDAHWIIIRAANDVGSPDPGYRAYQEWQNDHDGSIHKATEFYDNNPGNTVASGAVGGIPGGSNYRMLVVLVERYTANGDRIFGSQGGKVLPYAGSMFCQQVSNIAQPSVSLNSGGGGASGGTAPGGGDSPPPGPDPGGGDDLIP